MVLCCVAALLFIFSDELVNIFITLMNMEPSKRESIRTTLQIISAIVSILSFLISSAVAVVKWLTKPKKDHDIGLLKQYYSCLAISCERIDLSLLQLQERGRGIKLPLIYQNMDAIPYGKSVQAAQDKHIRIAKLRKDVQQSHRVGGNILAAYRGALRLELESEKIKRNLEITKQIEDERRNLLTWCVEDAYRKVVILGDAGFGKSMFVEALTWRIAQSHLGHPLESTEDLPDVLKRRHVLRLRLRAVALQCAEPCFAPQDLLLHAMQRLLIELLGEQDGATCWAALREPLLREGVILLDGLDEVPESEGLRKKLLEAIEDLQVHLGSEARLLISSRPYVFEAEHAQALPGFGVLYLQGMNNMQMEAFIRHWYRLTATYDQRNEKSVTQDAEALYHEIAGRDYLQEPARSPMILTLLIGLHLANIRLPESRAKLYEAAIDLMLDHWTWRARQENSEHPLENFERHALLNLEGNQRKTLLANLALVAHREKTLLISRQQILALFSEQLPDDCNATNLLDFVRYRSGLLKAGEGGDFEFYHRSFQAYLAARALTDIADWQDEINHLLEEDMDWWQEVYFLLIGAQIQGGSKATAVQLMKRYVPTCPKYNVPYELSAWPFLALATRALVEQMAALKGYDQGPYLELKSDVQAHLLRIVQQEYALPVELRIEAGRLLSEQGDPRPGVGVKDSLPDIDWVRIPVGEFIMGSMDDDPEANDNEKPAHKVSIKQPFAIARYPVTNAQFACFVQAGGYEEERYWQSSQASLAWWRGEFADLSLYEDSPVLKAFHKYFLSRNNQRRQPAFWQNRAWSLANHPVTEVSWYEAVAYSCWLSERYAVNGLCGRVRLPNEAEWEYAARGTQEEPYNLGAAVDRTQGDGGADSYGSEIDTMLSRKKITTAVGLFPPSPAFGLCDISSYLVEWTSSQWGKSMASAHFKYAEWDNQEGACNGQRDCLADHAFRIARNPPLTLNSNHRSYYSRCASRAHLVPGLQSAILGFRCVLIE